MRGQPIDQKQLRSDEDAWLLKMRNDCLDEACIQSRYEARLAELRDQSLKAASPAAYAETRPFTAPSPLVAQAKALVGKACAFDSNTVGPIIPGFAPVARFLPVALAGGSIIVREKQGTRFAFLTFSPVGGSQCEIQDVVVLPPDVTGERFLQCSVIDPALSGFGVRHANARNLDGLWSVNASTHHIDRVAMCVLGIEKAVRCQQPESGE